jgi:phosphate:Na+ symporter
MVVVLTAIHQDLIPLTHGAAMVIGSELGTGIKLLLGSIGGIADKKRVALGNFYINVITLVISAILLYPLLNLITGLIGATHSLLILVAFQSAMNLLSIFIFLPFLKQFADFLMGRFKKDEGEDITTFIHNSSGHPDLNPVELAGMEIVLLLRNAYQLNRHALEIMKENKASDEGSWFKTFRKLGIRVYTYEEQYRRIKLLQGEILDFIHEIRQENLSAPQVSRMNSLVSVCREVIHAVKNIKDIRHNIIDLSDTAKDHLYVLFTDLQAREKSFYTRLEAFLDKMPLNTPADSGQFQDFLRMNKEEHERETSELFNLLKSDKISELEVSTMLNVYREIYSSHKALIMATADLLKLKSDTP